MPIQEAALDAFAPGDEVATYVRRSARLHGHIAGRLQRALVGLGVLCPRPMGAFYIYPDFAPWRAQLAKRGVASSRDLARHLLDEFGIATLPGVAFGEAPEALRLRVATSGLCLDLPGGASGADGEARLWSLLEKADALPAEDPAAGAPLALPALDEAEQAFGRFVRSF